MRINSSGAHVLVDLRLTIDLTVLDTNTSEPEVELRLLPTKTYPPALKMEVADFMIFCSKEDEPAAGELLKNILSSCENEGITGYLYNDKRFCKDTEENVRKITVQIWFYLTDNFAHDNHMQDAKNEELIMLFEGIDGRSVIPIWTKGKDDFKSIPFGLASIAGLYSNDLEAMIRKTKAMFKQSKHLESKCRLQKKQNEEREKWGPLVADFILLFSKEDKPQVSAFLDDVKDKTNTIGYLYDDEIFNMGKEMLLLENVRRYAAQVWLYMTDSFVNDSNMEKTIASIKKLKERKVPMIPIWTKDKGEFQHVPYGLVSISGLRTEESDVMIRNIKKMLEQSDHTKSKKELQRKQTEEMEPRDKPC